MERPFGRLRAICQAKLLEYRTHPVAIAPGQIVVHCDEMHAFAVESVEVGGQRRDVSLPLTRLHLSDRAPVQNHRAHDLNVELPIADGPNGGLARRGERLWQKVAERLAIGMSGFEFGRKRTQFRVRERLHMRLKLVDFVDDGAEGLCQALWIVAQLFDPVNQVIWEVTPRACEATSSIKKADFLDFGRSGYGHP